MKQVKFFLVALMAAVMGVSVSSCLSEGENDPTRQAGEVVRANYLGSFTNEANYKLVPTNSTDILSGDMYYIYYQYDSSTITDNTTSVSVTLLTKPTCVDGPRVETVPVTPNAPIFAFNTQGRDIPRLFDSNTLLVPFYYWFKKINDDTEQKAELNKHTFTLYYDKDAIKSTDTELNFYMSHVITETETTERLEYTGEYRTYDIREAIAIFESITEKKPTKIVLNAKTNNSSNTLTNANNGKVTLDYK